MNKKRLLTEAQREEIRKLRRAMILIASEVGLQHAFWYHISDLEALLAGRKPMLNETPDAYIKLCQDLLKRRQWATSIRKMIFSAN